MTGSRRPAGGDAGDAARDPAQGTPEERLRALGADGAEGPGPADRTDPYGTAPLPDAARARVAADLASLSAPPLPAHVLAGIDRALAAERARDDTGDPRAAGPGATAPRPTRGSRRGVLLLVGLVAALLLAVGVGGTLRSHEGSPSAAPGPPTGPGIPASAPADPPGAPGAPGAGVPALGRADLPRALRGGLGAADPGPLSDPPRLAACLRAQPLPAAAPVLGARRVVLDGTPAVLLVLPTGTAARFRLLVVGDDCAAGRPATLSDTVVGR